MQGRAPCPMTACDPVRNALLAQNTWPGFTLDAVQPPNLIWIYSNILAMLQMAVGDDFCSIWNSNHFQSPSTMVLDVQDLLWNLCGRFNTQSQKNYDTGLLWCIRTPHHMAILKHKCSWTRWRTLLTKWYTDCGNIEGHLKLFSSDYAFISFHCHQFLAQVPYFTKDGCVPRSLRAELDQEKHSLASVSTC